MTQENKQRQHACAGREGWEIAFGWDDTFATRRVGMRRAAIYDPLGTGVSDSVVIDVRFPTLAPVAAWRIFDLDLVGKALEITDTWLLSDQPASQWLASMERLDAQEKK